MANFDRRKFLMNSSLGAATLFGLPLSLYAKPQLSERLNAQDDSALPEGFPAQDKASVREVVGASHANFERVKELVTERPELAKAVWDWGFGDWESALGAASHMGRADIAEFLIENGARPNLFTFTMLAKADTVKTIINESPGIQSILGPHGITLMRHARIRLGRGGLTPREEKAMNEIIEFLESVGGADNGQLALEISEEEQKSYMGRYVFGDGPEDYFIVNVNSRGILSMQRAEQIGRSLLRVEEHAFAPGGAPSVRIRFDVADGQATGVTIYDPMAIVSAKLENS